MPDLDTSKQDASTNPHKPLNLKSIVSLHVNIRYGIAPHDRIRDKQRRQICIRPSAEIELRKVEVKIEVRLRNAAHIYQF
jgi:hypothetical protein